MSDELLRLADRCEAAGAPDETLAMDIVRLDYRTPHGIGLGVNYDPVLWMERHGVDPTCSLDAALSLVPEDADAAGERYRLEEYNSPGVLAAHVRASAWVAGAPRVYAASASLALTAACLRARASRLRMEVE